MVCSYFQNKTGKMSVQMIRDQYYLSFELGGFIRGLNIRASHRIYKLRRGGRSGIHWSFGQVNDENFFVDNL
jgi:hypothetical protein